MNPAATCPIGTSVAGLSATRGAALHPGTSVSGTNAGTTTGTTTPSGTTAGRGSLPFTGLDAAALVGLGAAVLAVGLALRLRARRGASSHAFGRSVLLGGILAVIGLAVGAGVAGAAPSAPRVTCTSTAPTSTSTGTTPVSSTPTGSGSGSTGTTSPGSGSGGTTSPGSGGGGSGNGGSGSGTAPEATLPEAPLAALIPLTGALVAGALIARRRRAA